MNRSVILLYVFLFTTPVALAQTAAESDDALAALPTGVICKLGPASGNDSCVSPLSHPGENGAACRIELLSPLQLGKIYIRGDGDGELTVDPWLGASSMGVAVIEGGQDYGLMRLDGFNVASYALRLAAPVYMAQSDEPAGEPLALSPIWGRSEDPVGAGYSRINSNSLHVSTGERKTSFTHWFVIGGTLRGIRSDTPMNIFAGDFEVSLGCE